MDLVSILSITASVVGITYPFIADFLTSRKSNETFLHVEGDMTVNFNRSSPSIRKSQRITKAERTNEITKKIYNYIVETRHELNAKIKVLIFIAISLSIINLVIYQITGEAPILKSYIDYMIYVSFFNKHIAYITMMLTFFILYFSIIYFITLYLYDKKLESLINSNNLWIDYGSLKTKMISNKIFLKSIHYPSLTVSRIEENKSIETKNKAKRTKGDLKEFSEISFFNQYNFFAPILLILIINLIYFLIFSSRLEQPFYSATINKNSISYDENKVLTHKEKLFLLPQQFLGTEKVTFNAFKNDGDSYQVEFDSIRTSEPKSNFTRVGFMNTNAHLRFSPYGPEGETRNSNKPTLSVNQDVRVHKFDGEWTLVLTSDNRQGFVYSGHLTILNW